MSNTKKNSNLIAIITMCFIFAMISFVTNMAAPFGNIWGNKYEWSRMAGNLMNFAAYLFMGIPAGKMLLSVGYKKTTLIALATGFVGICIQYLSSFAFLGNTAIYVYLLGAFICGFCVCMLNTVVNPTLNSLGGGGNRGNQFIQIGGTLNSLTGTLTPLLIGALIGTVTANTSMSDVAPLLFIAMGVFVVAFIIISFVDIPEPAKERKNVKYEHSPWNFRHFVLGAVGIFIYVGIEVGIPGTLNFYLSDTTEKGAGLLANAAAIGGLVAGTYWFLMLIGRIIGGAIAGKVSSKTMMIVVSCAGIVLILLAMSLDKSVTMSMPVFTGGGFGMETVPVSAVLLVLCGLCTSVMWSSIFNLATEGLGKYTAAASGIFMMMVVGGGVLPLVQNHIADTSMGYMFSYIVPLLGLGYLLYYAIAGCKNVNQDIPVD